MRSSVVKCSCMRLSGTRHFLLQDCYFLDQGGAKIFVWKGKKANKAERQAAMSRALVCRTSCDITDMIDSMILSEVIVNPPIMWRVQ